MCVEKVISKVKAKFVDKMNALFRDLGAKECKDFKEVCDKLRCPSSLSGVSEKDNCGYGCCDLCWEKYILALEINKLYSQLDKAWEVRSGIECEIKSDR